jgi:hypothetical protein
MLENSSIKCELQNLALLFGLSGSLTKDKALSPSANKQFF